MSRSYGTGYTKHNGDESLPLLHSNGIEKEDIDRDTSITQKRAPFTPLMLLLLGILIGLVLYTSSGNLYNSVDTGEKSANLQESGLTASMETTLNEKASIAASDEKVSALPTPSGSVDKSDESQFFKVVDSQRAYLVKPGTTKEEAEAKYQAYLSELMSNMNEDEKKRYQGTVSANTGTATPGVIETSKDNAEQLDPSKSQEPPEEATAIKTTTTAAESETGMKRSVAAPEASEALEALEAPAKVDTSTHITVPSGSETSVGEHLMKKSSSQTKPKRA